MTENTITKVGKVSYVGAGPGNPELITRRGHELLGQADYVFHDTGLSETFFRACTRDCRIIDVKQRGIAAPDAVQALVKQMQDAVYHGNHVVRLKVGDPLFFSRSLPELQALRAADIPIEIVPGVASPLGAAAYTGVPLTDVDGLLNLVFLAATDPCGNPIDASELANVARGASTLCLLLVVEHLRAIVEALLQLDRFKRCPALLVHRVTLPEQQTIEAPLAELMAQFSERPLSEPALLIVGETVRHRQALNWYEAQPLFGKRLLLCRPREQAHDSASAILQRGAYPELLPLIEIGPVGDDKALIDSVSRLQQADWVIFTSANGVEQFRRVVTSTGRDARVFGRARIAVIGPGTAKPLAAWGLKPDLVAKEHVAEALAREILEAGPVRSVVLIRARDARDALPEALRAAGVAVEIVPAYQTRKLPEVQGERFLELLRTKSVDAVLLTSSSMAEALALALGPLGPAALANVCIASIGPITTATLVERGITPDVTASTFTVEGLLDALETHFARESSG